MYANDSTQRFDWTQPALQVFQGRHNESCQTSESQALFRPRQYLTKVSIFHYTDPAPTPPPPPLFSPTLFRKRNIRPPPSAREKPSPGAICSPFNARLVRIIDRFYFISTAGNCANLWEILIILATRGLSCLLFRKKNRRIIHLLGGNIYSIPRHDRVSRRVSNRGKCPLNFLFDTCSCFRLTGKRRSTEVTIRPGLRGKVIVKSPMRGWSGESARSVRKGGGGGGGVVDKRTEDGERRNDSEAGIFRNYAKRELERFQLKFCARTQYRLPAPFPPLGDRDYESNRVMETRPEIARGAHSTWPPTNCVR